MNTRILRTALLLALATTAAATQAGESAPAGDSLVVDCARPSLPSQRAVGRLLQQDNFSQVYASREELLATIRQACLRSHTQQVRLIRKQPEQQHSPLFASNQTRGN